MNLKKWVTHGIFASILVLCGGRSSAVFADALEEMVSPVSNPINFEDPRASRELRPIFIRHELGNDFATGGGDIEVYALQARYAIDDRLTIIATKDGYVDFNPNTTLPHGHGFANVGAGGKYAFYKDSQAGHIASAGLRYEIPIGDKDVLQGQGDGVLNPFLSGAAKVGLVNVMASTGLRVPLSGRDSTFYDLDLHADVPVGNIGIGTLYPLVEMNLVQVLDGGNRLPIADEGADVVNIGASKSAGKGLVTGATGFRLRMCKSTDLGFAYQVPLTRGEGSNLFDWRITADLIWRFDSV